MKKILSTMLLVLVITIVSIGLFTVSASAATSGTTGACTWTLDGTVLTISGNGHMGSYYYNSSAPWGNTITSVVIENGVTSIGYSAFSGCSSLISITIPNSVTSIGLDAFYNCTSLTSITIPNSVTSIGSSAFENCSSLTSITIPNSVTSIGFDAFYNCTSLTSITIPNSVTSIGSSAFKNCSSLTSITIPNSVTSIDSWAFYNCDSLESVTIGDGVTSIDYYVFANCSSLTSVTIGNSVTSIGDWAFDNCTSLTSITIPDSVIGIGIGAFSDCLSFTSITIPNSVTSIGDHAFWGCTSLESITIGNSVTSIGDHAFYNCSSLTSITIGDGVTSIGEEAFLGCNSLKKVNITDLKAWCEIDFYSYSSNPLCYAHKLYLNDVLITGSLVIPEGTTKIETYAFSDYDSLTSITIPNSVTSIDYDALSCCDKLASINVDYDNNYFSSENGVLFNKAKTEIISYPQGKISTSYTIPNSVTSIGDSAFSDCTSLESITIPNSVTSIGSYAFDNCDGLTSITIGDSVTSIGDYAFCYCDRLTSITIPNSATSIGDYAFYSCDSLTSITIPNSVTSIGEGAFYTCDRLWHVLYTGTNEQWQAITIGSDNEELTSAIRHCNFNFSNLTVTEEKPTCTEGGYVTFNCAVCESSTTSYVDSLGHNTKYIRSIENCTLGTIEEGFCDRCEKNVYSQKDNLINGHSYENGVCSKCGVLKGLKYSLTDSGIKITGCDTTLTEVIIPNDISGIPVTSIGGYAFSDCDGLTSITIPDSVTSIGYSAFSGCSSLTSITIPNSVTSIGDSAFSGCSSLTSITIPNSVTSIYYYAFESCWSLRDVWYTGSQSEKESITIMGDYYLVYATWHYNTCEDAHIYTSNCDTTCNDCEWVRETTTNHTFNNSCDTTCNVCGATRAITHKYDSGKVTKAATCKATGVKTYTCTVCQATKTETIKKTTTHKYKTTTTKATLSKNGSIVKKCSVCGYVASTTPIKYVKSFALTTTNYTYTGAIRTPGVIVKDSAGKTLVKNTDYTVSYSSGRKNIGTYKVTVTMKGNYTGTKTLYFKINPISYSKCKFALTTTNYTYTGAIRTPGVIIKYGNLTLKKNVDYTVAYSSGRKNVGTYKVTVKMKGKYSGAKTLTFKINPPKTTVSKLTAGKKSITVAITKKSSQVTGYQVQYSTSKSFSKATTKTISSYKTTKYTLKSLSAKKTYYVRVRTYKTVGKTKYYSGWSTYKYVKTK